jgi:hypothetical protein
MKMMTIAGAIQEGAQRLREGGVPEARREAGSLLSFVLGRDRTFLIGHADEGATEDIAVRSHDFLPGRRLDIEPLHDRRKSSVDRAALI